MYFNVLLVSDTQLKAFTNINKNVDSDLLKSEIMVAQDVGLQTILGTKFYKHLLSCVSATGNTFNPNELTLVEQYITPYLIHESYYQALPHLHYKTLNRSIQTGNNENGQSVDIKTLQYLRGIQKQRSDFYMTRLIDWLILGYGQNLFPDYLSVSTYDGQIPDRQQKYNVGIFLNKTSRKGYGYKGMSKAMPMYSEIERAFTNCPDCY